MNRDDEASNFADNLDNLQDRRQVGSDGPSFDCDAETRAAFRQCKQQADTEAGWDEFADHARKRGNDPADSLNRSMQWDSFARQAPAMAAAQLRTDALTTPPSIKERALAKSEDEQDFVGWAKKPAHELMRDTSYEDTRSAILSAMGKVNVKDARKRADEKLNDLTDLYGIEAGTVLRNYVGIDKGMLADPVGFAPTVVRAVVEDNQGRQTYNAAAEIGSRLAMDPEVRSNPELRHLMGAWINKLPNKTLSGPQIDEAWFSAKAAAKRFMASEVTAVEKASKARLKKEEPYESANAVRDAVRDAVGLLR